jgi:hypothetical protein
MASSACKKALERHLRKTPWRVTLKLLRHVRGHSASRTCAWDLPGDHAAVDPALRRLGYQYGQENSSEVTGALW